MGKMALNFKYLGKEREKKKSYTRGWITKECSIKYVRVLVLDYSNIKVKLNLKTSCLHWIIRNKII